MRILAFDTSTRSTSAALLDTDQSLELELRDDPAAAERPRHTRVLLPMITKLIERSGAGWESIDRLAVGRGPGTFTGLRIGIATARALARARELDLVGVPTLRSLALNGSAEPQADSVLAVLDARRGEAFAAAWARGEIESGPPVLEPPPVSPRALGELARRLAPTVLAIGDGALEFREVLERSGAVVPESDARIHAVTAINHCRLASVARTLCFGDVLPEYLRVPDAELARRAKLSNEH